MSSYEIRQSVREALEAIRAIWRTLQASREAAETYARAVEGLSDEAIRAGTRTLLAEYSSAAPPKPADFRTYVVKADKWLRGDATPAGRVGPKWGEDAICDLCGTAERYTAAPFTGADGVTRPGRVWPLHRDGCLLRRADQPTPQREYQRTHPFGQRDTQDVPAVAEVWP